MSSESKERVVEYWETEQLPSMKRTSTDFVEILNGDFGSESFQKIMDHPFLPKEQIFENQFKRLADLVNQAYANIPFYRKLYDTAGFEPGDLKTLDDYHNLPIVTKDDLISAFPSKCVDLKLDQANLFPTRSSGSSGKTLRIYVDPQAIVTDTLQGIRQFWLQSNGLYKPTDVITHVYTVPWWVDHLKKDEYQNIFISSLINSKKIAEIIDEINPKILSLYPSNLESILPFITEKTKENLNLVVTHSEMSSKNQRDNFAARLSTPVLDEYSSEELTRIALEMPDGQYYLCEDTVRADVLDPKTLKPIDSGVGLLVATNLLNEAMPFIRYQQGDGVVIGKQIESRINWRQVERVGGRSNDSFIRADGSEVPAGTILDISYRWMFDIGVNIQEFEIIQDAANHITINLNENRVKNNALLAEKSFSHIKELLKYVLGENIDVSFNLVDHIEKTGIKKKPIRRTF